MARIRILVVMGALSLACAVFAPAARAIEIGVKGGVSIANQYGNDARNEKAILGPAGAISLALPLAGPLQVQPEVRYVTKGSSFGESEGTDEAGNPTGTFEALLAVT